MIVRLPILILAVALGLPAASAHAQSEAALATVNGTSIPQSRFDNALALLTRRGNEDTPELRKQIRDELITREVVQQEAVRLGLDQLPEFAAALEEQRRNLLVQVFVQDYIRRHPVSESAVREEYDRLAASAAQTDKQVLSFEEAAPKVRASLAQQNMRRAVAELRSQAAVE